MRIFLLVIIILIFVAAGIAFGALNPDLVGYDFGLRQVRLPKGAALLGALLLGWILGGLVAWLGMRIGARTGRPDRGRRGPRKGDPKRS